MSKNFFKSEIERLLWIKLNAERIQYTNKIRNHFMDEDLGNIDDEYSPLWVSNNQLVFDEKERDELRYGFEELLLLTPQELYKLSIEKNNIKINELWDNIKKNIF